MNSVEINIKDVDTPDWLDKVESFCLKILDHFELANWELSILFCNDIFIADLNKQYRDKEGPTDILSFSQTEGEDFEFAVPEENAFFTGDLVISLETLAIQAKEFNISVNEELKRILIHGILHLQGYDHSDNSPEQEMLKLQEVVLQHYMEDVIL